MSTEINAPVPPQGMSSFGPWFSEVFRLWTAQWQVWVVQGLIYLLLPMIIGGLASLTGLGGPVFLVLYAIAFGFFMPGMVLTALKQIRGERIEIADIFLGINYFGGALLIFIVMYSGLILCGIGSWITTGLFALSLPVFVDRKVPAGDAIGLSWKVTTQNPLLYILFFLAIGFLAGAGSVVCCVGIIATIPWFPIALAVAYEHTMNASTAEVIAPVSSGDSNLNP